jgi:hypothetical protein
MQKLNLLGGLSKHLMRFDLDIHRNAPRILVFSGVAGVVASTLMACHATTKLDETVTAEKAAIQKAREIQDPKEMKKELTNAYFKTGVKLARLYLPSVGVGVVSMTAILSSHHLMERRNNSLAAAYTGLSTLFNGYRNRVAERYGEEVERRLRYNIHEEEIEETVVDKNGKEKVIKKKVDVANIDQVSDYARYFMRRHPEEPSLGSEYWEESYNYQETFLNNIERHLNDRFDTIGKMFLNEAYLAYGFPESVAGQTDGWVKDLDNPVGENFIKVTRTRVFFKNKDGGLEPAILLDFNVQGNILGRAFQKGLITK